MNVALQELIELLYKDNLSQYGKKRLEEYINKQQKEIEEGYYNGFIDGRISMKYEVQDKIREKIKKAKEIKWQIPKLVIEYFEELLEEN